jgi:LmbE family N-acetylglucosaminyl deacetylase
MGAKTVICVVAHADDLTFAAAGTVIRFVEKGYKVYEVVVTDNGKGSHELSTEALVRANQEEAKKAAVIMGIDDVIFLGYKDGELGDVPSTELRERIMQIIRYVQADVLMTWDPFAPYEPHPDHRAVGMAATEAAKFAALPLYHPEHIDDGLELHYVGERYYFAKHPVDADKIVDIAGQIDRKIDALCQHESQMKFLVDGLKMEMAAAGISVPLIEGVARNEYRTVVEAAVRGYAAQIGRSLKLTYAERFRYEGFYRLQFFAAEDLKRVADF